MKARIWMEHLARDEWGNELMREVAAERFRRDPSIDVVEVCEHGGWHLSYNRDLTIVGTANDMAQLSTVAHRWAQAFDGAEIVGEIRRDNDIDQRYPNYFPALSAVA